MSESLDLLHARGGKSLGISHRRAWLVAVLSLVLFSIPFGEFQRALLGGATVSKIVFPVVFLFLLCTNAFRLKIHPHLWLLLLFITGTLPSLVIGQDFEPAFVSLLGYVILFEVLYNANAAVDDLRRIFISYVFGLFVVSFMTIMAALGFDMGQSIGHPLVESWYGVPVFRGTEQNPNGFATFFVPGCVIAGYLYFSAATRLSKLLSLAVLSFFSVILVMTGSRSGVLGAFLGLVIIYLNRRIFSVRGMTMLVGIIGISSILILTMPKIVQVILLDGVDLSNVPSQATDKEASIKIRIEAIGHFFEAFSTSPLVGIGYGNLAPHMEASAVGEKMGAHNVIIGVAIEMGVAALLPFLIMIFVSATCMAKALTRSRVREDALFKACHFGAFVGLLFHGMFHEIYINFLFWFFMAAAIILRRSCSLPSFDYAWGR